MKTKRIVVMGTLDTRGEEIAMLRSLVQERGQEVIVMDLSTKGEPAINPDIPAHQVAMAAGADIQAIQNSKNTAIASTAMIQGATVILKRMLKEKAFAGIISIGGASGTTVATSIMQKLPFGLPKVMVSSTAAMPEYAGRYFGTKDLVIFHSVVDIAGINSMVEDILKRAAGCVCGMVNISNEEDGLFKRRKSSFRVAMTEFKFSEPCCYHLRKNLQKLGLEVIAYHAQGIGDSAMEEAIDEGLFDGVLDIVPAGLAEKLLGGNRAAGEERLEAAGKAGIPQVLTPCGFDMLSCGPLERRETNDPLWMKRNLGQRKLFIPDAYRVQARTSGDELKQVARLFAEKLNNAWGPVAVVVPLGGWSTLSEKNGPLWDSDADRVFLEELRSSLSKRVDLTVVDAPLNSQRFSEKVMDKFMRLMGMKQGNGAVNNHS